MYHHWNEVPHRFGLFGVNGAVRPQYFVYRMLAMMGGRRLRANCDATDVRVLASSGGGRGRDSVTATAILIVNCDRAASKDRILNIRVSNLKPGQRSLLVCRIDRGQSWSAQTLELLPTEHRDVDVQERFAFQVFAPGDSVTLVTLGPQAPEDPAND
jgi:hypothetical protein